MKTGRYTHDQVAEIAKEAMVNSLKEYKPANISVERGMDTAIKIRDLFLEEENEREGIFAHEVEINDLLPVIRCMVMGKEFFN